jgi:SAM-dependent methyltransferase
MSSASYHCNYCNASTYTQDSGGIRDWEYGVAGEYRYLCCDRCQGVQIDPFPSLDDLKIAYDIDYHGYAQGEHRGAIFSILYRSKEWLLQRQLSKLVNRQSKVLDVGCGAGDFLLSLRNIGIQQLEGIDFSPEMIARLQDEGIGGHCGTFDSFDGTPSSYDLIAMNNYLEHTLNPQAELAQAEALLAPGAHLTGEVPCYDSWERKLFGRFWGGNHAPRHTYQFAPDFLRKILHEAGFTNVRIQHQLNTSHWALSVQNYLQRNKNLRDNPDIINGRSRWYVPLLVAFIPINIVCVLAGKSGCIKFTAQKKTGAQA